MRLIDVADITKAVKEGFISLNLKYPNDIREAIIKASKDETSLGKSMLEILLANEEIAINKAKPLCQDTGMSIIFIEIGQEVQFINGDLAKAIQAGVKAAYVDGYLRKSIVSDPLFERINTNDNTPAIINYKIVSGDKVKLSLAAKGFGSENMSKVYMLKPAEGVTKVKEVVLDTIKAAGANACPPMVVGVGIGGNFEYSATLAKKATLRPLDIANSDERYAQLEAELFTLANELMIGPQGLGGKNTVLKVQIEQFPTHIASLPVAVNISCHATRHYEVIL